MINLREGLNIKDIFQEEISDRAIIALIILDFKSSLDEERYFFSNEIAEEELYLNLPYMYKPSRSIASVIGNLVKVGYAEEGIVICGNSPRKVYRTTLSGHKKANEIKEKIINSKPTLEVELKNARARVKLLELLVINQK